MDTDGAETKVEDVGKFRHPKRSVLCPIVQVGFRHGFFPKCTPLSMTQALNLLGYNKTYLPLTPPRGNCFAIPLKDQSLNTKLYSSHDIDQYHL